MTMPIFDPPTHRMVNGARVPLTPAESDSIVAEWQAEWTLRNNAKIILQGLASNTADARVRWWQYAILRGKTPAEIFSIVQGRIDTWMAGVPNAAQIQTEVDAWANLANVKASLRVWLPGIVVIFGRIVADLREWLPMIIAAIAWTVLRDAHTSEVSPPTDSTTQ